MFRVLLDDLSAIIKTSNGSETWRNLVTYKNMLRAIESMAVEMSFGIIFIGNGQLSTADFARFIESHKVRDRALYMNTVAAPERWLFHILITFLPFFLIK